MNYRTGGLSDTSHDKEMSRCRPWVMHVRSTLRDTVHGRCFAKRKRIWKSEPGNEQRVNTRRNWKQDALVAFPNTSRTRTTAKPEFSYLNMSVLLCICDILNVGCGALSDALVNRVISNRLWWHGPVDNLHTPSDASAILFNTHR